MQSTVGTEDSRSARRHSYNSGNTAKWRLQRAAADRSQALPLPISTLGSCTLQGCSGQTDLSHFSARLLDVCNESSPLAFRDGDDKQAFCPRGCNVQLPSAFGALRRLSRRKVVDDVFAGCGAQHYANARKFHALYGMNGSCAQVDIGVQVSIAAKA